MKEYNLNLYFFEKQNVQGNFELVKANLDCVICVLVLIERGAG